MVSKKPAPFSCFDDLKPLNCTTCDFSTEFQVLLRYHLVHNHDQKEFALKAKLKSCKTCGFYTRSNYLWIRHRLNGTCKGKKTSNDNKRTMKKDGKWYLCEKCDYRSLYSSNLNKHVIYKHTSLEDINWQQCKKCKGKFKTLSNLKHHMNIVHGSAVDHLRCSQCDYSTPLRWVLTKHINRKHTRPEEIKWVECPECGAKFKEKENLKLHLVTHKITEELYKCDICDYQAKYESSLQIHKRNNHGDVKRFKCERCDYRCKHKVSLKHHVLLKHNDDGEVYQCKECDYNTRLKNYFNKHLKKVHKQSGESIVREVYQCKQCDYKTILKTNLTTHMKKEHERSKLEPIITCQNCLFVTTTERLLKRHMFNKHTEHTEEEKLNCAYCTYFCFSKRYLSKHLRRKHQIGYAIRLCDYRSQSNNDLVNHIDKTKFKRLISRCVKNKMLLFFFTVGSATD